LTTESDRNDALTYADLMDGLQKIHFQIDVLSNESLALFLCALGCEDVLDIIALIWVNPEDTSLGVRDCKELVLTDEV